MWKKVKKEDSRVGGNQPTRGGSPLQSHRHVGPGAVGSYPELILKEACSGRD